MRIRLIVLWAVVLLCGCAASRARENTVLDVETDPVVSFQYVGKHLLRIPVRINDQIETHFILDTGVGVNLISKSLCARIGCRILGSYTGKRMSGQSLELPLSRVPALAVASSRLEEVKVGIWDLKALLPNTPEFSDTEGFISLGFFRNTPFTIDYQTRSLIIEDETGLRARRETGTVIPVKIDDDQMASLTLFMPVTLPDRTQVSVEVDTGSDSLILDEKFMPGLRIDPLAKNVKKVESKDETENAYIRYFAEIAGPVNPGGLKALEQRNLQVMFQKIIFDGLIGDAFLKQYVVTYDLPHSEMIFNAYKRAIQIR